MAPLPLNKAKNKRTGFLTRFRRKLANVKAICDGPEDLEVGKLSTASDKLTETWQKYEDSQQDVFGLITGD